jgi:hypothetical protein
VDELVEVLFAELLEVKQRRPERSGARTCAGDPVIGRAKYSLRENGYWIGQLMTYDRLGLGSGGDPRDGGADPRRWMPGGSARPH